jgi:hypothetical protein
MQDSKRDGALDRLELLAGAWDMEAIFPGDPPQVMRGARSIFEWALDEKFLIQRTEMPGGGAPNSLTIVGYDESRNGLVQHYFDSRGVARLYDMTFDNGTWTLSRDKADFSPLHFSQRFSARFEDGGHTIRGAWEKTNDAGEWVHDFELIYRRL